MKESSFTNDAHLEAEALDVVRDRGIQIFYNEERTDRREIAFHNGACTVTSADL